MKLPRESTSHGRPRRTRSLSFEPLEGRVLLAANPLISEFMAVNDGVLADQDGDFSDWLELHNAGDTTADLTGWHLTDDASDLDKWTLPAVSLAPGAYLLVYASGKDRSVVGSQLHTNFNLSSSGEYLALVAPDGESIASEYASQFPEQRSKVSYGMLTDAGGVHSETLRYFTPATPGAPNSGAGYAGFAATPDFSVPHGFFTSAFNVSIADTTPGATIRYTVDGSAPSQTNGTVYTGPLNVDKITMLRAAAFATDYLPSFVETQTYLFPTNVLTQTRPSGYPTNYGTAPAFPIFVLPPYLTPADYEIDPEVVNNPAYTNDFLNGLTSIPSVSLVMKADDLFGPAGIYSHPWERGDEWEYPGSIELINPDGTPGFQIDAGLRILGNASRQPMLSPKHSFRVEFRSEFGETTLDYPLFGDGNVSSFDSLVLRSELSDSWVSPQGAAAVLNFTGTQGRPRAQYARDNFARETQLDLGQLAPKSMYVNLYVNGMYWGLHDFIERRDEEFVASHLGGTPADYDVLQDDVFGDSGAVVSGDAVTWNAMMALANSGLANDAQYQQIQQYLDVDAFIDYMNLHLYVGSQDWPNNNWTAYRNRAPGGKFFFTTWDAEYTLHDPTINRTGVSDSNSPGQLWSALKNNAEFRLRFADRAQALLFNGGPLTPGPAAARYTALVNQIEDPLVAESARWGDYRRDVHPFLAGPYELSTRDSQWVTEKNRLLNTWFPTRTTNVINQYKAAGVYPNVVAPAFNQHGGQVVDGFQLTMTAPAGVIYYTLDGSDPRLTGGGLSPTAVPYSGAVTFHQNMTAKARALNGGVWSALDQADFLIDIPQVRITELMYHPQDPPLGSPYTEDDFEYVEIQNIGPSPINLQNMKLTEGVTFTFPDMVLNPGQYTVVVENLAAFESRYGTGISIAGQYSGKFSDSGELVTFEDSFGQSINSFTYSEAWQPITDGSGYSLVIVNSALHPSTWDLAASWRASTTNSGSPGAADPLFLDADVNLDGAVNIFDINLVSANWNTAGPVADANRDGIVNIFDINLISSSWGMLPGGGPASGAENGSGANTDDASAATSGEPVFALAAVEGAVPGDANGDGAVGFFDLMLVSTNFRQSASVTPSVDVNGDGEINIFDVNFISANWGRVAVESAVSSSPRIAAASADVTSLGTTAFARANSGRAISSDEGGDIVDVPLRMRRTAVADYVFSLYSAADAPESFGGRRSGRIRPR